LGQLLPEHEDVSNEYQRIIPPKIPSNAKTILHMS